MYSQMYTQLMQQSVTADYAFTPRNFPADVERWGGDAAHLRIRLNTYSDWSAGNLGGEIACLCSWQTDLILAVCLEAMTAANMHTERALIARVLAASSVPSTPSSRR